jgi:hypothetical protein
VSLQFLISWGRKILPLVALFMMSSLAVRGQEGAQTPPQSQAESLDDRLRDLQKRMSELQSMMTTMHEEMLRSRAEVSELRRELEAARPLVAPGQPAENIAGRERQATTPGPAAAPQAGSGDEQRLRKLEEEQQLSNARLQEQNQTKVESASKYRVKLSGAAILNLISNQGTVDNLDFPSLVPMARPIDPHGSFGASLRQSLLGLEVFGPEIKGARVSADLQFDFAGGFPNTADGVTLGLARLRTGVIRIAGPRTTLVAGQDAPFFSPLSPSSIASLALPAFAYAGNLWTWTPQIRVEHRVNLTEGSSFLLQGGLLDPLTGEPPAAEYLRIPNAGEASRQPAYAARSAWSHRLFHHELVLGVGGYYGRQNWAFGRNVDAWAGTTDWTVPLGDQWEFSGEFYRGRAVGGLGAAIGRSVVFSGPITDPSTQVRGLNATGGWAQIKFRQTEKLEWNGAFGQDSSFAGDLRRFPLSTQSYFDPSLARNRSGFLNFIYRPRSDLLLSVEYRRLRTISVTGDSESAGHINVSMGVLF